jgi:hypothetical protein
MDLLPELKELTYCASDDDDDAFKTFVYARQNHGHPVTLIRRVMTRLPRTRLPSPAEPFLSATFQAPSGVFSHSERPRGSQYYAIHPTGSEGPSLH